MFTRIVLHAFYALLLTAPTTESLAANLHVLMVADNEQGITQHTKVSVMYMNHAIEANIPADQVHTKTIEGDDFKTSKILAAIDGISPEQGDSILLFYIGHGALTRERKPYMVSGNRAGELNLTIATAMKRLSRRGAFAVVAIFDMCSVCPNCNVAGFAGGQPANQVSPLFRTLFFQRGVAGSANCIISSSPGQPALTLAPISPTHRYDGGMYTWCFAKHLTDHSADTLSFDSLHTAVRNDVARASTWHPNRDLLTNDYGRKQVPVRYDAWKR